MKLMSANTSQYDAVRPTKEVIPRSVNAKPKAAKEVEVDVETVKVKQHMSAVDVKANKAAVAAASSELDKRKAEVTKVKIMETRKDELKAVVETANLPLGKGTVWTQMLSKLYLARENGNVPFHLQTTGKITNRQLPN